MLLQDDAGSSPVSIFEFSKIANVGNEELSLSELLDKESSLEFQPIQGANTNLGFTTDKYWLKFSFHNESDEDLQFYLETGRPITDKVDLYFISTTGDTVQMKNGDLIPFKERSFPHRKIIFPISLAPGNQYTYYLHYQSDGEVINLPLQLHTKTSLILSAYFDQLIFGIFYGVLVLAGVIYLFFYFGIKEKSFLLYVAYVISVALLHLALDGFFFQYFAPGAGWFSRHSVLIFATLSALAFGRYTQTYLKAKEISTKLNTAFNGLSIALILLLASIFFIEKGLALYYPIVNILGFILLFLIVYSLLLGYWTKKAPDIFFSIGILCFFLGFLVFLLNNFSAIPNSFLTENSSKLGTGMEIVFLSLSMANRIRLLKSEKEKIQEVALFRAQESNQIKTFFLSNISHELRTPLNAIIGLSRSIQESTMSENVKEDLQVIQYSSLGLLGAIDDILDFSKIEKKELKLEIKSFDFYKLLREIKSNYEKQCRDKGLTFIFEESNNLPKTLIGDLARTRQIIQNILNNAIKFTASGEVKMKILSSVTSEKSVNLQVEISDTGIGIKKEKLDSIFESFIQGQLDDKREFGGFGLGLCIVHNLVELHGGKVSLESEEEKGTRVSLEIPYDLPYPLLEKTLAKTPEKEILELEEKLILVVEDNPVNQLVMKSTLRKWKHFPFEIVGNGLECLEKIKTHKFDLILMDLQMPVMDGYEATLAIRKGECGEKMINIPIIAVTADATDRAKRKVMEVGMDEYISKPLDKDELYTKINACLKAKEVALTETGNR
ncbi:hybrid sensor histidine kinase/response regulator [Rhodonellum sp.]|uniref:hybrid sensor histidine kinase/response regulator n=1 Tax=Rhodonellum sp. TaxID=2231180 RepID=UPI002716C76E|nr:hybrid sensor histidine kinase/response regulator [Rhodonellum sp.]MDO9553812.1 7TM diverse intracellular signaling domain-containing protein [Rhodonellum sp.]